MDNNVQIITNGSISKEEILKTVDHNTMPNTMVLENLEPFPGYHGANLPSEPIPLSIFLVSAFKYSDEDILRTSQKIKKYSDIPFTGSPATIKIHNETYPSIRLWGLNNFEVIGEIQKFYMNEGIKFRKKRRIEGKSIIQIRKSFHVEKLEDGIYRDIEDNEMIYLQIPALLSWGLFHNIIMKIKNNLTNNNFDAALGTLHMKELVDIIRIFTTTHELDELIELKDKITDEINTFYT